MARIVDNEGHLLGGLEVPIDRLFAPFNKRQNAAVATPAGTPHPPVYGPKEDVPRLICSYGSLPLVVYSASGNAPVAGSVALPQESCRNQVDKPQKRHYCPACDGYYCAVHADPASHACQSVMKV